MLRKVLCIIFAVFTVMWTGFIFSNSLDNARESTKKSDLVYEVINDAIQSIGIDEEIPHATVRQGGHLAEFFGLGVLASASIMLAFAHSYKQPLSRRMFIAFVALPFSTVIAIIDEYIQTFSDGRVSDVEDVFTDSFGAILGIAFILGVFLLLRLMFVRRQKKENEAQA